VRQANRKVSALDGLQCLEQRRQIGVTAAHGAARSRATSLAMAVARSFPSGHVDGFQWVTLSTDFSQMWAPDHPIQCNFLRTQ